MSEEKPTTSRAGSSGRTKLTKNAIAKYASEYVNGDEKKRADINALLDDGDVDIFLEEVAKLMTDENAKKQLMDKMKHKREIKQLSDAISMLNVQMAAFMADNKEEELRTIKTEIAQIQMNLSDENAIENKRSLVVHLQDVAEKLKNVSEGRERSEMSDRSVRPTIRPRWGV